MVARHCGIRTERWKLVHYYPFDEWKLFDLASDPDERTNLFGRPEHAATAARLAVELGRLQQQYDDTTVTPPPTERQAEVRRPKALVVGR